MSMLLLAFVLFACAVAPIYCRTAEQDAALKQVMRKMVRASKPKTLPPTNGDRPLKVSIGYALTRVEHVSNKGYTDLVGMLSLMWRDPRLAFRSRDLGVDVVRLPVSDIWTPDVQLYNALKPGTKDLTDQPLALVDHKGDVSLISQISTRASCDVMGQLHTQSYANCTLKFGSWTRSGLDLDLQLSESKVNLQDFSLTGKWNVTQAAEMRSVKMYSCCPEPYIDVTFSYRIQERDRQ